VTWGEGCGSGLGGGGGRGDPRLKDHPRTPAQFRNAPQQLRGGGGGVCARVHACMHASVCARACVRVRARASVSVREADQRNAESDTQQKNVQQCIPVMDTRENSMAAR
jgi:hypothetical protein